MHFYSAKGKITTGLINTLLKTFIFKTIFYHVYIDSPPRVVNTIEDLVKEVRSFQVSGQQKFKWSNIKLMTAPE